MFELLKSQSEEFWFHIRRAITGFLFGSLVLVLIGALIAAQFGILLGILIPCGLFITMVISAIVAFRQGAKSR